MRDAGEIKVTVWNTICTVTTDQMSKTVWRASGEYQGERCEVKDRSASTAIKRWKEWARYKGG
jgi:hypothetical protein